MTRELIAALALATGCVTDLDVESVEQSVEPGCTPKPTHYCDGYTASATYPSPGFEWAPALYACWERADINLGIACQTHGTCCGGSTPGPNNHAHNYSQWIDGVWHCTGTIGLKIPCTAGSTNPECQPTCI